MIDFLKRPWRWAVCFSIALVGAFAFILLDTFVIPRAQAPADSPGPSAEQEESGPPVLPEEPVITEASYSDGGVTISIETARAHDTTYYVADIRVTDPSLLRTALAGDTFGRNIKETTSEIAEKHGAILAVNGDYYGFRDEGYVLRNGTLYRDVPREPGGDAALLIDGAGDFSIAGENELTEQLLEEWGIRQVFSFGPALVEDGQVAVTPSSEVAQSMRSNPRTAIGQIAPLHYVMVVSDGRTRESAGLSLAELAEILDGLGCQTAYNLDGGGSSTMVFNGRVVNNPTNGRRSKEREVSDIVYIGYR